MKSRFAKFFSAVGKCDALIGPWLFYIALILEFLSPAYFYNKNIPESVFIMSDSIQKVVPWICVLRLVLLIPKHYKYVLGCLIVLAFCLMSLHFCGRKTLLDVTLLIVASRGTDVRKSLGIFGIMISGILLLSFLLFYGGYTGDLLTHSFGLVGHSWGINNSNTLSCFLLILAEVALLLMSEKFKKNLYVFMWGLGIINLFLTLCATTTVILFLFPILLYLLERFKLPLYVCAAFPWFLMLVSVALMLYYGPSEGETTFESRFSIPAFAFEKFGMSWMGESRIGGSSASVLGLDSFFVDNLYLRLLLYFGVVPGLLVMLFECLLIIHIARHHGIVALSVALCVCLIGLMESYPLFYINNIALAYFGDKGNIHKESI